MSDPATDALIQFSKIAGMTPGDLIGIPPIKIVENLRQVAMEAAPVMSRLDLFQLNGEYVYFDDNGNKETMTESTFITWIGEHILFWKNKDKDQKYEIPCSLSNNQAKTILDCVNFKRGVRKIKGVNHVRLPVLRTGASLEQLPWGYDAETQIYTVPGGLEYRLDLPLEAAKGRLYRQLKYFPITDDRSMAVQIAALLALFIRHLPEGMGLRPGFLWYANKPGSGKSVLAKACLYIVMGHAKAAKLKRNEDLDKEIEAFCRAAVPYIFLDNIRGGMNSTTIEQMLTSEESTGRAMGGHGTFDAKNTALLLATANGKEIEINDDTQRRFLLIDLFEKGDPEEREYEAPLNGSLMRSDTWRVEMLEALWALVRTWHEADMPKGSKSLASFEEYAWLLGGIVEAAGYAAPFAKAELPDAKMPGREEFTELLVLVLDEMGIDLKGDLVGRDLVRDFTNEDLCRISRSGGLFQKAVGTQDDGKRLTIKKDGLTGDARAMARDLGYMDPVHSSPFGKIINKEVGTEPVVGNRKLEFGSRSQARKRTYTIKVLM